jgi:hypothetical protein
VDCNETGLTPLNIEAIYSVADSSNLRSEQTSRYIGDNRIGLKLVFKAAGELRISSSACSYIFGKSKPAGMITPIQANIPEEIISRHSSFHMRIAETYFEEELTNDVNAIDLRN